jgi:hypothetical protein
MAVITKPHTIRLELPFIDHQMLGALQAPTSSSCGALVAFGNQLTFFVTLCLLSGVNHPVSNTRCHSPRVKHPVSIILCPAHGVEHPVTEDGGRRRTTCFLGFRSIKQTLHLAQRLTAHHFTANTSLYRKHIAQHITLQQGSYNINDQHCQNLCNWVAWSIFPALLHCTALHCTALHQCPGLHSLHRNVL